jgi:hypothetical protein
MQVAYACIAVIYRRKEPHTPNAPVAEYRNLSMAEPPMYACFSLLFHSLVTLVCIDCCRGCVEDITTRNCRTLGALRFVLSNADVQAAFVRFRESQHSQENVLCWKAIQEFKLAAPDSAGSLHARTRALAQKVLSSPSFARSHSHRSTSCCAVPFIFRLHIL